METETVTATDVDEAKAPEPYRPFIKVTSWGTGLIEDLDHGAYLGRPPTAELYNEQGEEIDREDMADEIRRRFALCSDPTHSSCRRVFSLMAETEEDRDAVFVEVQQECARRYGAFLLVRHGPDRNHDHDHAHALIFRDIKNHPMRNAIAETEELKQALSERFQAAGIKFAPKEYDVLEIVPNRSQAEQNMLFPKNGKPARPSYREPYRQAVNFALANATDYEDFKRHLEGRGYSVAEDTETKEYLSIQNEKGRRCRIGGPKGLIRRPRLKSKDDVITYLQKRRVRQMEKAEKEQKRKTDAISNTAMQAGGHAVRGAASIVQAGERDVVAVAGVVAGTALNIGMTVALPLLLKLAREKGSITEEDIIKAAEAEKTKTATEDLQAHGGVAEPGQHVETIDDTAANVGDRRHGDDRRAGHERREGVEAGGDDGYVVADAGGETHRPKPNAAQDETDKLKKANAEALEKAEALKNRNIQLTNTVEKLQGRLDEVMQQARPRTLEQLKELLAKDGIRMNISKSVIGFVGPSGLFQVLKRAAVENALQSGASLFAAPVDNGEAMREEMAHAHGYELMSLLETVDAKIQQGNSVVGPGRTPDIRPDLHR